MPPNDPLQLTRNIALQSRLASTLALEVGSTVSLGGAAGRGRVPFG